MQYFELNKASRSVTRTNNLLPGHVEVELDRRAAGEISVS